MASKVVSAINDMKANGINVTSAQRNVLRSMSENASDEGFCWYSRETVALYSGIDESNVQDHLKNLARAVLGRPGKGRRRKIEPRPAVLRVWRWISSSGRQAANLYKIELPGLRPVTARTVSWLKSQRGGRPAIGWEAFAAEFLPSESKDARGGEITPPQSEARGGDTTPPEIGGEGGRSEASRGGDLGAPGGAESPPPINDKSKETRNLITEKERIQDAIGTTEGGVPKNQNTGNAVGAADSKNEEPKHVHTPTFEELKDADARILVHTLYGQDETGREAQDFIPFCLKIVGLKHRGKLALSWGDVLGIAGDVRDDYAAVKVRYRGPTFVVNYGDAVARAERFGVAAAKEAADRQGAKPPREPIQKQGVLA